MRVKMNRAAIWCGTTELKKGDILTPETHSRYMIKAMLSFGYADLAPKRKKKEPEIEEADNG